MRRSAVTLRPSPHVPPIFARANGSFVTATPGLCQCAASQPYRSDLFSMAFKVKRAAPSNSMLPQRNKRRICVALYHRNKLSLGDNRARLGYEAYHWAIFVRPKTPNNEGVHKCNVYDATDMAVTDPVNHTNLNPDHDWFFRAQRDIDPNAQGRLIGLIIIGKIPKDISDQNIADVLSEAPVPRKDVSPPESCVTWVLLGLSTLQSKGWIPGFDIGDLKDWALEFGDECMKNLGKENVCEYRP